MLRVLFADQGDKADLLRSLAHLRDLIAAQHALGRAQVEPYLDDAGPFPGRAHLAALFADLYSRLFTVLGEWAQDAIGEVSTWESTADLGLTPGTRELLRRAVAQAPPPARLNCPHDGRSFAAGRR